jgi:hypothetical protein
MQNIDILKNAVEKASHSGYVCKFDFAYETGRIIDRKTYYAILFDFEFCKAIWGEEQMFLPYSLSHTHTGENCILWQWHIKQMVISADPIQYLKDNIEYDSWKKLDIY